MVALPRKLNLNLRIIFKLRTSNTIYPIDQVILNGMRVLHDFTRSLPSSLQLLLHLLASMAEKILPHTVDQVEAMAAVKALTFAQEIGM